MIDNPITIMVFVWTVIRKRLTQPNYHSLATELPLTYSPVTVNFVVMQICIIFYVNIKFFLIFSIFNIYLQY